MDQLLRPKHFPEPVLQYTLKELTIVWHLYGGHDFSPTHHPPSPPGASPGVPRRNTNSSSSSSTHQPSSFSGHGNNPAQQSSAPYQGVKVQGGHGSGGGRKAPAGGGGWKGWNLAGGPGRDHSVHVEVEVDKVHVYSTYCTSCTDGRSI